MSRGIPNHYRFDGNEAHLIITRRNGTTLQICFDTEDFDLVRSYHWRFLNGGNGCFYVASGQTKKSNVILFHRLVANTPDDLECDVLSGDYCDLRKRNLRNGEHWKISSTKKNRTKDRLYAQGITYLRNRSTWGARVWRDGKSVHLATGRSPEEAMKKRDAWIKANPEAAVAA